MPVLPYGAIEGVDCERVAIILPTSVYEEGEYPDVIVAHHVDGLTATPVRFGIEYVPKDTVKAENEKLRALMRDTYDCICEMYAYMDGGYAYEDAEADPAYGPILRRMRDLGVEVDDDPPMSDAARRAVTFAVDGKHGETSHTKEQMHC